MVIGEYYFLFALALLWTIFAVVQDLRKTEIANWLNFSLIGFALAYRAFFSVFYNDYRFFWFGLLGFGIFFALAYGFYYSRAFAGGDAKLLMAFGAILPFESYSDLFLVGLMFLFILFISGAVYSLIYSLILVGKNWNRFRGEFILSLKKRYYFAIVIIILAILAFCFKALDGYSLLLGGLIIFFGFLYYYLTSLDKCMIVKVNAGKLIEGDWLEEEVRVGGKKIGKSVHGLSLEDIALLKRYGKSVVIKKGIPFAPAFLIALLIMGFFFLFYGPDWLLGVFSQLLV